VKERGKRVRREKKGKRAGTAAVRYIVWTELYPIPDKQNCFSIIRGRRREKKKTMGGGKGGEEDTNGAICSSALDSDMVF